MDLDDQINTLLLDFSWEGGGRSSFKSFNNILENTKIENVGFHIEPDIEII